MVIANVVIVKEVDNNRADRQTFSIMQVTYKSARTSDQIWDNLPTEVKSLLTIAMLDEQLDRTKLARRRLEIEASLATAPQDKHFDILCKMAGIYLLELTLPSN